MGNGNKRNSPCQCGSGKKFKLCCMNIVEDEKLECGLGGGAAHVERQAGYNGKRLNMAAVAGLLASSMMEIRR